MADIVNTLKENFNCAHFHAVVQAVAWILDLTGADMDTGTHLASFVFLVTFTLSITHYMMMVVISNGNHGNFAFLGTALSLAVAVIWVINMGPNANDITACVFFFLSFALYALTFVKEKFMN